MDIQAIGNVLKSARLAKGLVLKDVADAVNVSIQAVGNWERGRNGPAMAKLIDVARFLEIDVAAASRGELVQKPNPGLAPADAMPVERSSLNFGPKDVEVLGVTVGGDDADFYLNGEVVNTVRRPPGIQNARGVFALNVVGDSMVPRYDPGELIYCQRVPPAPGDYVVIELYPENAMPAGKSFIKKLKKRTGLRIVCEQFNPPKDLEFDAGDVKGVYRVIPLRELLG